MRFPENVPEEDFDLFTKECRLAGIGIEAMDHTEKGVPFRECVMVPVGTHPDNSPGSYFYHRSGDWVWVRRALWQSLERCLQDIRRWRENEAS
jgi:hypothetical protein